jgi:hypothetical protein
MSGTRRRPRTNPRQTWHFTDEVLTIYQKMTAMTRADDAWWAAHNRLVDLLQTPPDLWPIVAKPGENFQTELQRQLDEALSARDEVEPVQYS